MGAGGARCRVRARHRADALPPPPLPRPRCFVALQCEICGDFTYYGPRAFEKHFGEWRHREGLKRLGLTWSREMVGITSIEEAKRLHHELQERKKQGWTADAMEEMEDAEGNVYSKRTFNDLLKQGIIKA